MSMFPFIKICGIQNLDEAKMAIDAGATAIGCLVGLTHKAEDKITARDAASIFEQLPKTVNSVLVTHFVEATDILELCAETNPKVIQVHGDANFQTVVTLADRLPEVKLIKAVHVGGKESVEIAEEWSEAPISAILLDSRTRDRLGGTGKVHDWNISREIVELSKHPVVLAGGLNPDNVAAAVRAVRPSGVDVNSGVEKIGGEKDASKVRSFIENARIELNKYLDEYAIRPQTS